uniref:Uncharacterized protein n=1 Tax=Lepeophtheirus salmonis TaxID=72036 RepID=A0A0K2VDT1_LEPSM
MFCTIDTFRSINKDIKNDEYYSSFIRLSELGDVFKSNIHDIFFIR